MGHLTEHFTWAEAVKSQLGERLGIDNTPPAAVVPCLVRTAEMILEPVRAAFGRPFVPSSWYRCPELNKALGSKDTSSHVRGEAVDFEVPGVANLDLARWIAGNLTFDQLILEFYKPEDPASGWVHCAYGSYGAQRGDVLTLTRTGGKTAVKQGLPA